MLLKDKNAVITGCLRGIGKTTMEVFARNGANIWACCQAPDPEFEGHISSLQKECEVSIIPVYFDLSDSDQIKNGMRTILSSKKKIDILVNNAGITHNALFHMTTMENMKHVFEIDFFSQLLITQYITKVMARQKSGSVITISSISGIDGNPGQVVYSAAKAALIGVTKTLSAELAEFNIRVNAIAPGIINTNMTAEMPKDKYDKLVNQNSLNRAGTPEEVANTLLFLASDMSSYITGQVIRVDGGIN
jgi:3-oxoacyl-[acyl-carrier protein] reductase